MFVTHDDQRSPLSGKFGDPKESYWPSFELAVQVPWFLMTATQTQIIAVENENDAEISLGRTWIDANIVNVIAVATNGHASGLKLESAYLVMPDETSSSSAWKMERLLTAWTRGSTKPKGAAPAVDFVETISGYRHFLTEEKHYAVGAANLKLICRFP